MSIKTEHFTMALKLYESQGHFCSRTFCNSIGGRTTGLLILYSYTILFGKPSKQ